MNITLPIAELLGSGILVGLICLLCGFAWGRHSGRKEGTALGRTEAAIVLRERALMEEQCPVCGSPAPGGLVAGESDRTSLQHDPIRGEQPGS